MSSIVLDFRAEDTSSQEFLDYIPEYFDSIEDLGNYRIKFIGSETQLQKWITEIYAQGASDHQPYFDLITE